MQKERLLTRVRIELTSDLGNRRAMGITVSHEGKTKKEIDDEVANAKALLRKQYEQRFGVQTDEQFNSKLTHATYVKRPPSKERVEHPERGTRPRLSDHAV